MVISGALTPKSPIIPTCPIAAIGQFTFHDLALNYSPNRMTQSVL